MSADMIGMAIVVLSLILVFGKWVRLQSSTLQKLFLPSSLIGGFIALLLGPEVLGRMITAVTGNEMFNYGFFTEDMYEVWASLPGLLINVVFACLFIGFILPKPKEIWKTGGPQIALGYTLSWGQYVVGILLALLVLSPLYGLPPAAGALIEIGFVGGHGTAAGLEGTFEQIGFPEGYDLAVGLATVGVLSGVITGVILINWATRRGKTQVLGHPGEVSLEKQVGVVEHHKRESAGQLTTSPMSIEPLSLHVAYVGIAIFTGWLMLTGLQQLEQVTWGAWTDVELMAYMPLFPFAMIGGIFLQLFLTAFDKYDTVDRGMVLRIQGLALDLLIVSALATLALSVLGTYFVPFIILSAAGIMWNVIAFIYLAPRMIPNYWFERGMGDLGQSMGVAATGLLLMRVADPDNKTPAMNAFGYKQILFEPVVGGGLFTAASIPFIIQFGPIPVLIGVTILMAGFWILGVVAFGPNKTK
ncbi:ESS family glutamate:Na+ symporter [Salsuginibacillus halophilus]|uniref:ESS family glutamate:Na+ symporter n=1 Tax=Salsuginibacillus halophilus TaxID=517424 RepID=A0A2P8HCQ1_9BACI|nr:sodium/glutamate symporter [Salsuginibacillus halophilus]PSL44007.1 ESS family glutamate:Na+ symporter [Salsuginibacillus halophilus]